MTDTSEMRSDDGDDRSGVVWWRRGPVLGLFAVALVVVGGLAVFALTANASEDILVETAVSVGDDPFATEALAEPTTTTTATPAGGAASQPGTVATNPPGLYGGSGDQKVCDPASGVAFLMANPDKAAAWIAVQNNDPTFEWSGGRTLTVKDIPAYFDELRPILLTADTRVTNHGFKNGKPTAHQSLLQAGTAVLIDKNGVPRARCACLNPLIPAKKVDNPRYVGTKWTGCCVPPFCTTFPCGVPTTTTTAVEATSTTLETTTTTRETTTTSEPKVIICDAVRPLPDNAADVTTAPVDFDGDGTLDLMRVYRDGTTWHIRADIGGTAVDDRIISGPGPMSAIGAVDINGDGTDEAWVQTGSTSNANDDFVTVALYLFRDCELERPLAPGGNGPNGFLIGSTTTSGGGVGCNSNGIQVYLSSRTGSNSFSGSVRLVVIDLSTNPASLVQSGPATSVSTPSTPAGVIAGFHCGSFNIVP